jgi:threonine/homoserine/homoserine lactone efflux protein
MELFFFIAVTHFIALLSPGPDFFLILIHSMKYSSKLARYTVFGIAIGNALILLLIFVLLWGLGQIHPILLQLLSYLGIAYLLYLALQCFRYRDDENKHVTDHDEARTKTSGALCFIQGLQSSLLNPKNVMFYSSLILLVYSQFSVKQFVFKKEYEDIISAHGLLFFGVCLCFGNALSDESTDLFYVTMNLTKSLFIAILILKQL